MLSYNDVHAHIFLPTIVLVHTKNSSLSGFVKFTTMVDIIPEDYSRVGIHEEPSYLDIQGVSFCLTSWGRNQDDSIFPVR